MKLDIRESLDFYKICSSYYVFNQRKLHYINAVSKINMIYIYSNNKNHNIF
ncbi:hypothetical protein BCR36DRAFT_319149 [Piromyces finnis]|uniref:Uncharacterized protein n=1 Tax=Piromyces finnis TaxID=1754191 RepID=A0A1Y1VIF5_9FUNG|nr:hypothetical protein BCR36DRAFT_319149 [Piromyces finnis]|eukprot:ORX57108.1 hypothetical protein BCR36DRAFT_319149 [Piromyces finnis]